MVAAKKVKTKKVPHRCLMCRKKLGTEWYCVGCLEKKRRIEQDSPRAEIFRSMPNGAPVIYGHVVRKPSLGF